MDLSSIESQYQESVRRLTCVCGVLRYRRTGDGPAAIGERRGRAQTLTGAARHDDVECPGSHGGLATAHSNRPAARVSGKTPRLRSPSYRDMRLGSFGAVLLVLLLPACMPAHAAIDLLRVIVRRPVSSRCVASLTAQWFKS